MRFIFTYASKKPSFQLRASFGESSFPCIPSVGDEVLFDSTHFSFVSKAIKNRELFMWKDGYMCGSLWFKVIKRKINPGKWVSFDVEPVEQLVELNEKNLVEV